MTDVCLSPLDADACDNMSTYINYRLQDSHYHMQLCAGGKKGRPTFTDLDLLKACPSLSNSLHCHLSTAMITTFHADQLLRSVILAS